MTDTLETLRRLAPEAATEGPWTLVDDGENYIGVEVQNTLHTLHPVFYRHFHRTPPLKMRTRVVVDMSFAAHTRTDVPRLCKALAEALEPLASMAEGYSEARCSTEYPEYPDDDLIDCWYDHNSKQEILLCVADARRAAEVLNDQTWNEALEVKLQHKNGE